MEREIEFAVELQFDNRDIQKASRWADSLGYRYEDTKHLLFDAMFSGAIRRPYFREVIPIGPVR